MEVNIYSTKSCPYCKKTKKFLDENKIDYQNYDVADNKDKADEMVEKSGQMGVPVIEIDGEIVVGFNKSKLKELLNIE